MMGARVKAFGARFFGRVDAERLQFAIDYVDYNKSGLAFETICDYLIEADAPISEEEYRLAEELYRDMEMKWGASCLKYLQVLVASRQ
ncbi:UNVERIFIED_ORG: hypothetical protein J2806_000458 [Kosakonia oryzae]|uniref:MafI family immunity protein n=1 Tax=Kosakonia radicincitans TaxID=283686 RepID=A0AAX2EMB4_9ENTR|nr:MafI family immunity protein [Kosakonia radicincitans]MDP9564825.1 hypothetical protein [Kosakonia oryzae]SFD95339.1 hypothetical protein SAMN03159468_00543 [Kosakonia radicincitans]SFQ98599.1 hypothetical protein SAMN03159514_00542 [Kosakonia radicincitans]SFT43313.1 hypothetical protein SAMN03159428_00541 [Kosakonia radicincitans]SFX13502.1 hypothetical protein SAMN03159436_00540 [Kosakonia radicincitans]